MSNTTCALITLHNAITKSLDNDVSFGAAIINFDFSKAFHTLPHHRLLEKLQNLHFQPVLFCGSIITFLIVNNACASVI